MREYTLFQLPKDLPSELEPGAAFEVHIFEGHPSRDLIFRTTRPSETREFFAHKLLSSYTALDVGRVPAMFVVGEILTIVEFKLTFEPAVIVRSTDGSRKFLCCADEGQSEDDLVAKILARVDER